LLAFDALKTCWLALIGCTSWDATTVRGSFPPSSVRDEIGPEGRIMNMPDAAFCPRCGAKRHEGMTFCGSCGFDYGRPARSEPLTQGVAAPGVLKPSAATPRTIGTRPNPKSAALRLERTRRWPLWSTKRVWEFGA
jgi:hypothetical protein